MICPLINICSMDDALLKILDFKCLSLSYSPLIFLSLSFTWFRFLNAFSSLCNHVHETKEDDKRKGTGT